MLSPFNTHKNRHPNPLPAYRQRGQTGFTLIELLVVIGIIGVLAAFAIPAIYKAMRGGAVMKAKADFQVISTGLEAFRADTGDYPRVEAANTGFAVLCKALVAPFGNGRDDSVVAPNPPQVDPTDPPGYSATVTYKPGDAVRQPSALDQQTWVCTKESTGQAPAANSQYWAAFSVNDQRDGPGTKVRAGGANQGPYLQPDRVKIRGCALIDAEGNAILYFPASPKKPNINQTPMAGMQPPFVGQGSKSSLFDASDNFVFFLSGADTYATPTNAVRAIRAMLGDFNPQNDSDTTNADGTIQSDKGENALSTGPYILWSAGNDGIFGPVNQGQTPFPVTTDPKYPNRSLSKCDDVTNFK